MFITKKKLENLLNVAKNKAVNEFQQKYQHTCEINDLHSRIDGVLDRVVRLENALNSQDKSCSCKKSLNE